MFKRYTLLGLLLSLVLVACPAPEKPLIASFTTTPSPLPVGGGTTKLEWQVAGADSISIDNGVGVVTGASKDINVTSTKTFTLTATNAQGDSTQTVTVTVLQKPIIASFTATPSSLPLGGGTSKLEWQVTGADSISIDNGVGVVTGKSKGVKVNVAIDVTVAVTKTFTLTATNAQGTTTQTATVSVAQKPVIASFKAVPSELPLGGGASKLEWEITGADSISIDNGIGVVTGTSKDITVDATKTFTITATNAQGTTTQTATVTVTQKPIIASFTATPNSLPFTGGSSKLEWQVSGADSISIDNGVGVVTGTSADVNVTTTKTFTLTATNANGISTKTVTVTVLQKPVIASFTATPSSLPIGGGSSKLEWQVTGADSISVDNGVGIVTGTSKNVAVDATKTFTITATNGQGSTTQTATVTVAEPVALTNLSGSVTPWTRGARLVKAGTYVNGNFQNFLLGDMNSNGVFNVPLVAPPTASLISPTLPASCNSSIVAKPLNPLFASIGNLSVVTSTGVVSGSLVQTNFSSQPSSGPRQAGDKYISYVYANQNGTLKGTCSNSNGIGSLTIDWIFKMGWNAVLFEYVNATDIRYSTIQTPAIPADIVWKFVPLNFGGTITITNPITSLELGKSVTLQATAIENDGTPIANPEFVWTSSDPTQIEVTPSGVATAKVLNPYGSTSISVTIKNYSINSVSMYVSTYGFEAIGGTFNLEDASLGTAVRMRYQGTPGTSLSTLNYTITGPNGWNNNQPLSGSLSLNPVSFGLLSEIPAVSGLYQLQTDTGSTSTFTIDTTKKLPPVTNFKITSFQNNQLNLTWDNIPGFDPYSGNFRLQVDIKDQTTGQFVVSNQQVASSSGYLYTPTLDSTHTYAVYLVATQGYQTGEVTTSRASAVIDFHPEISQLSASGGAKNGGYTLTINGFNFDINTSVFFGSVEATSKTLQGTNSMQVIVPAGTPGMVDIKLSNARGTSTISALSKFTYYDVQEFDVANSSKLLASSNGAMYFIEENSSLTPPVSLAKITSAGTITRVGLNAAPLYSVRDMTLDTAGNVWIALDSKVLRVSTASVVTEVPLPSGVSPQMIAVGSDNNLWIARGDSSSITRMQTDGSNANTFPVISGGVGISTSFSSANEMLLGPDGNIWFTTSNGYGKVTPTGSITVAATSSGLTGMIFSDGAFWIASQYSNNFTRVDPNATTATTYTSTCSGSRIARGSDSAFWCGGNGGFYGFNDIVLRTTLTGTVGTTGNVILSPAVYASQATDLVADSNGKIWYLRGTKIGVISP
jgi:IPT/TIG domain